MMQRRFYPIIFLFILVFAVSCGEVDDGGDNVVVDGAPTIVNFDASPPTVSPNGTTTLSWRVNGEPGTLSVTASVGASPGVVTGASVSVQPVQTTTYTLTAQNSAGSDSATLNVEVSGDPTNPNPPPPGNDTTTPTGDFGVSSAQGGPFQNDRPEGIDGADDARVVKVAPGGTFYAQVSYSDPSGISAIEINLVNSSPGGIAGPLDPEQQFFTLGTPTGCDLASNPTDVTCVYPITVADDAVNISQLTNSEFAYVLRTKVTDTAGNQSDEAKRGYVVVTGNNSNPPTDPPTDPNPPTDPPGELTAAFTAQQQEGTLRVQFNATASSSPDGDIVSYTWDFGDGTTITPPGSVFTKPYAQADTYTVKLTVTDSDGATDSETKEVTVESVGSPVQAPVINSFTVTPSPAEPNQEVTLAWELAGGEPTSLVTLDTENGLDRDVLGETSTKVNVPTGRTFRLIAKNAGGTDTEEVTLDVSGEVVNPGISANDDSETGSGVAIEVDVLANDNFPSEDEGFRYPVVRISSQPAQGQADVDDGTVQYFPPEGFVGEVTFEYTFDTFEDATNEIITSNPATVTVNVTAE